MKRKGFTLIELLIVIAIIGVLAAALYPTIRDALSRGRDAAREGDLNNIATAIETFNADYGQYPSATGCIDDSTIFEDPANPGTFVVSDYFKGGQPPKDPSPSRTTNVAEGPGPCADTGLYYYEFVGGTGGVEYVIGTVMESDTNNNMTGAFDPASYTLGNSGDYFLKVF
jgi:prepilin-type N-terminal cleavage/methylation domain-containing protein